MDRVRSAQYVDFSDALWLRTDCFISVTLVERVKYDATDPYHAPIVKQAN
jgi:hypothetical protein